ncbi:NEL-type E3 ubiquitin ligase domain-containing protein [Pseudomonas monteilii]|uniref:NEL-type E3 ubiquitin ligase domain-containing protein n=1 Tax=Pseudomonas monteilii TaxID=76759 RepID=UPI000761A32D|nr:NEL-type E3 ubiquitin ligase domain-containing protein [Pseudomonas monteilii]
MPDSLMTPDSVDALIGQQLPKWLKGVDKDLLQGFHQALRNQQAAAQAVKNRLEGIPSLEVFAAARLEQALHAQGLSTVDVRGSNVHVQEDVELPSVSPRLFTPVQTIRSRQSLLAAALHNFHESETHPALNRKAHLRDLDGNKLPLSFEAFARCCRKLDLGGEYQAVLRKHLFPKSRPPAPSDYAHKAVQQVLEENLRTQMEVAVRMARIKGELLDEDYLRLLPVVAGAPRGPAVQSLATPRQLFLLGKRLCGVVTLEMRHSAQGPLDGIIVWVPQDPYLPLARYDSWEALYRAFAKRLRSAFYRSFFGRFISERDRPAFISTLLPLIEASSAQVPAELDGRNFAVDSALFVHLRTLQVDKLLDDARVLAVPTDDETQLERDQRIQAALGAGLEMLNLAALFIPVLGQVMFAVAALGVASEVYKGYEDWQLGDRQGALQHLFNVAQGLATGAALGAAQAGIGRLLPRAPFVDGLTPVHEGDGRMRLAHAPETAHYLDGNGPLLRQFGGNFATAPDAMADALLRVIGLTPEQLRQLHLESAPVPARLNAAFDRWLLHERSPQLRGSAFERDLTTQQGEASPAAGMLLRSFPGLSVRSAEEVLANASGTQLKALLDSGRVPLAMAEHARWMLHDSRLDRAFMGFEHESGVNADTQRLAIGMIDELAPWPAARRIELRLGEVSGRLIASRGHPQATEVLTVIQTAQGYRLLGAPEPSSEQRLWACLLQTLDAAQKGLIGDNQPLSAETLAEKLAVQAASDRRKAAQLLGMQPIGGRWRPPRRLANGRIGYPLSGRAESSRQALRRGIHSIFPTLSEAQLDDYFEGLVVHHIGLWEHLGQLQQHLANLRAALEAWQRQRVSFLDGVRRRRVVTQIRRAWRRKSVGASDDDYILHIEGERVGSLPVLPAGIDFGHIRQLTLRDMDLTHIDEDFLRRFSGLRELRLQDNRLTSLPAGLERLTSLRTLNLAGNRLTLDASGVSRLAMLSMLRELDLSANPLGNVPDLSRLQHVRVLSLRATGLQTIPSARELPWRGLTDLRENQIRQVTGHVASLQARLHRLALHDNPLEPVSESLLESLSEQTPTASRRGSYQHADADSKCMNQWLGEGSQSARLHRTEVWERLQQEPQSTDLFRFLADFAASDDFRRHPRYYRARVWRVLELCAENTDVREAIFWQAAGPRSCEDQLLFLLSQIEIRGIIALSGAGEGRAQDEATLLRLGRSLYRLDQIDRIAARHIQFVEQNPYALVDDVEVYLAYRINLAGRLDLPGQPLNMHYADYSGLTGADILRAGTEVLEGENIEVLSASLAEREFWQSYVRNRYPERFEALAAPYHERLAAYESEADSTGEQVYLTRADELMRRLNADERALYLELARDAYGREA